MDWRGFLNEPYCSMGCKLIGANEGTQAALRGLTGDCVICGTTFQASPSVRRGTVVPFGGTLTFVCVDDTERGKELLAVAATCSKCGADLD